jgi:hypothetical protein
MENTNTMNQKFKLYLDDVRTPYDPQWIVVRSYNQFVREIQHKGLENFDEISLDHDLDDSAMNEFYNNVISNGTIDYNKIIEKTGMECAKYLVNLSMESGVLLPQIWVHSFNPVGSENIMGLINNYLKSCELPETCEKRFLKFYAEES